jgi:nucleotide-binding universal stress UspA family protein
VTDEVRRKFINQTPIFVGAVIYDEDNKRKGVPVAPGDSIWLSEREERATAEAPRLAKDNPFEAEWEEPIQRSEGGEVLESRTRRGMLVLSDEPPRPIASERFIPGRETAAVATAPETAAEAPEGPQEEPEQVEEVTGSPGVPPTPTEPPVEGQPSEHEIVATPEAVPANDTALAARREGEEAPTPVADRPQGTEAISTPPSHHPLPV